MALHDDLLEQAHHLATRERTKPRQASLRRAVSTAYYAIFHLLITETVCKWKIGAQRSQLARIFEHARMNSASERVLKQGTQSSGESPNVVAHLKRVATAFRRLYDNRQSADYDTSTQWSRTDVVELVDLAQGAFASMKAIRHEPIVHDYLLSLFVRERR